MSIIAFAKAIEHMHKTVCHSVHNGVCKYSIHHSETSILKIVFKIAYTDCVLYPFVQ